jgi:hypothetical protein
MRENLWITPDRDVALSRHARECPTNGVSGPTR